MRNDQVSDSIGEHAPCNNIECVYELVDGLSCTTVRSSRSTCPIRMQCITDLHVTCMACMLKSTVTRREQYLDGVAGDKERHHTKARHEAADVLHEHAG